jgi:hypothetical protein
MVMKYYEVLDFPPFECAVFLRPSECQRVELNKGTIVIDIVRKWVPVRLGMRAGHRNWWN